MSIYNLHANQQIDMTQGYYNEQNTITATNAYSQGLAENTQGTAVASQVKTGKTFSSNSAGTNVAGTMPIRMSNQTLSLSKGQTQVLSTGLYEGTNTIVSMPATATYTVSTASSGNIDLGSTNNVRYISLSGVIPQPTGSMTVTTNGTYNVQSIAQLSVNVQQVHSTSRYMDSLGSEYILFNSSSSRPDLHDYRYLNLASGVSNFYGKKLGENCKLIDSLVNSSHTIIKMPMRPGLNTSPIVLSSVGDTSSLMDIGYGNTLVLSRASNNVVRAVIAGTSGQVNLTTSAILNSTLIASAHVYNVLGNGSDAYQDYFTGFVTLLRTQNKSTSKMAGITVIKCVYRYSASSPAWEVSTTSTLVPSDTTNTTWRSCMNDVTGGYVTGEQISSDINFATGSLPRDVGIYSTRVNSTNSNILNRYSILTQRTRYADVTLLNITTADPYNKIIPFNYFGASGTTASDASNWLDIRNNHGNFTQITNTQWTTTSHPIQLVNIIGSINPYWFVGLSKTKMCLVIGELGKYITYEGQFSTVTLYNISSVNPISATYFQHTDWWISRTGLLCAISHTGIDLTSLEPTVLSNCYVTIFTPIYNSTISSDARINMKPTHFKCIQSLSNITYYRNYMYYPSTSKTYYPNECAEYLNNLDIGYCWINSTVSSSQIAEFN